MTRARLVTTGLVATCALAGCDSVFGSQFRADASVTVDNADAPFTEAPRLEVPALFPTAVAQPTTTYLLEGTGWHGGTASTRVPFAIRNLHGDDVVRIRASNMPVAICGTQLVEGEQPMPSAEPCLRGPTSLGLTVAIAPHPLPSTATPTPLVVLVDREGTTFELPIAIVALDESTGVPDANTLYSTIAMPAIANLRSVLDARAVSDVTIAGNVDLSGTPGATSDAACGNNGCAGGLGGSSPSANGASSGCATPPCSAATQRGGDGVMECNPGTPQCLTTYRAPHAGGGGNGEIGSTGASGLSCSNTAGGVGGLASADRWLVSLDNAHGGGGGAGGNTFTDARMYGGGGGGGGGVLAIETHGQIRFEVGGRITVRGGTGGAGRFATCNNHQIASGSGGGGAGGSIRLRAASVTATGALGAYLDIAGGITAQGGSGSAGRIRLDATGTTADSLVVGANVVRGPDLDLATIIDGESEVLVQAHSSDMGVVYYGWRHVDEDRYSLGTLVANGSAVSLMLDVAEGLSEICVFVGPQADPTVSAIPEQAKRCRFVVRVDP